MSQNTDTLERLKLWLQIVATIVVPIFIVYIGNQVQKSIAENELSKSYVQMAIEILKVKPSDETAELRQWAVATVDKLSPIPLSRKVKKQLESGEVSLPEKVKEQLEGGEVSPRRVGRGMIGYTECNPVKDKETAEWMLKNEPYFRKCPKDNEVGEMKLKFKPDEGPLEEGESKIILGPRITDRMKESMKSYVSSIECRKVKDKETAMWLLRNYQGRFYQCQKDDEVGVEITKKVDNESSRR